MRQSFRQIFFTLNKENNKYLNEGVIKEYLCFVGNFNDFSSFFAHFDDEIEFDYHIHELERIRDGYPVQYVTGKQYFYGHDFNINEDVLIPRQETEQLVYLLSGLLKDKKYKVLDLCSGSGAIGISLKLDNPFIDLTLSDISPKANEVCLSNLKKFNVEAELITGDLFNNVEGKFDVIVCNPPYIENESNIDEQTYKYEPHLALLAKPGYLFYERILKEAPNYLTNKGIIAFEIEEDMEEVITRLVNTYIKKSNITFYKDICNKVRFVIINVDYE